MKLIFSFYRHPQLGLSLNAYLVHLLDSGTISYQFQRLVYERMEDYRYPFTDDDRKILKLIAELSQAAIEKQFNRKRLKWELFLEKAVADKALTQALSGYFDRRISACLDLLRGREVYWKERTSDHPGMKGYHVMSAPPKAVYAFNRTEDGIRYQLEVSFNGRKLDLWREGTEILSGEPCWLLHNGCIYGFADGTDGNKLKPFLKKREISIPDKLTDQYLASFMLKASRKFEVRFEGFQTRDTPEEVRKVLRLTRGLGGFPRIQLEFRYDHLAVTAANQQPVLVQLARNGNGRILVRFRRDFAMEDAASEMLIQCGLKPVATSWYAPEDSAGSEHASIEWLRDNRELLDRKGFFIDTDFEGQQVKFEKPVIELLSMDGDHDWFDIRAVVKIGDIVIPFLQLRRNILERNRNWLLPDGSMVLLPEAWFAQYAGLFEFGEEAGDLLRLHRQHHGLLEGLPLIEGDIALRLPAAKQLIYTSAPEARLKQPEALRAALRDYQLRGLNWLWNLRINGLGACLADDMGLGKTIQVIALLLQARQEEAVPGPESGAGSVASGAAVQLDLFGQPSHERVSGSRPALIVMAPSLVHNWLNELKKFAPGLDVYVHTGQKRRQDAGLALDADVVLTTYGLIRNDIHLFRETEFSTIVLDESQLIKNVRSVTYQRVRQLRGQQRIVMTGTPVENSLADLWSQLSFLQPGLLGSFAWFRKEFIIPVEKNNDQKQLEKLKKVIQPFILRRTKEEVAPELPALTRLEHFCEMDPDQRDRYEQQKSAYRNAILQLVSREGIRKSQFMILRGLMQLRKIAIHPVLDDQAYAGSSAKFDQVTERLEILRAEGKKVLMFSQFVRHLELYRDHFLSEGIPFSMLTGSVPLQARADLLSEFERSEGFRVFLIQLKTGGSGLNLTQADSVFILDPWWNPAAEAQAIARSHRIGQFQPVFAWRFITRDTIEEKILRMQERKNRLAREIISGGNPFSTISREELEELFS